MRLGTMGAAGTALLVAGCVAPYQPDYSAPAPMPPAYLMPRAQPAPVQPPDPVVAQPEPQLPPVVFQPLAPPVGMEADPVAPANADGSPATLNPVSPGPYDAPAAAAPAEAAPPAPAAAARPVPEPASAVPLMGFRPMRGQTAPAP